MTERQNILGRIREALKTKASRPGPPGDAGLSSLPPTAGARRWLPAVGSHFKDWVESFSRNAAELQVNFQLLSSSDEMRRSLLQLRNAEGWKRLATHAGMLPDAICPVLGLLTLHTDRSYDIHELEKCDVGIS